MFGINCLISLPIKRFVQDYDWSTYHSYAARNKGEYKRVRGHPTERRPLYLQEFKDAVHAGVVLDVRNNIMASDMVVPTVKQKWVIT